jgi:hypothetical protein
MKDDVLSAAIYETRNGGGVSELLNNRLAFATDPVLAHVYGVPVWDGTSAAVPMPSPARVGLLTRAAFLADGQMRTRPIMKGQRIRSALMCDLIPDPPNGAASTPMPPVPPVSTTRERVEALTQQPGTICSGCHQAYLNPLGFITENFDGLGRERTVENVYDLDGGFLGSKAIHTDAIAGVISGDTQTVQDAAHLTHLVDTSRKMHSCLAQQYFNYTMARVEDPTLDGCPLSALEGPAMEDMPLEQVLQIIVNRPEFKGRLFQ